MSSEIKYEILNRETENETILKGEIDKLAVCSWTIGSGEKKEFRASGDEYLILIFTKGSGVIDLPGESRKIRETGVSAVPPGETVFCTGSNRPLGIIELKLEMTESDLEFLAKHNSGEPFVTFLF